MSDIFSKYKFILASGSPRRIELIRLLGIEPFVKPSSLEENAPKDDPEKMVKLLSSQKALDIAKDFHDGEIVIGFDTCVWINGEILGKPKTHEEAYDMVKKLSGNTHHVYTGVSIVSCGSKPGFKDFAEETRVNVRDIPDEEIKSYSDSKEPMDKAGAYGIQGIFSRYIEGIEGDFYNVMGLPVSRLYYELKSFIGE